MIPMPRFLLGPTGRPFQPVNSEARRKATMVVLESSGETLRVRELCSITGLRPGAQRRALRQLHRQGRVRSYAWGHWKDRTFEAIG